MNCTWVLDWPTGKEKGSFWLSTWVAQTLEWLKSPWMEREALMLHKANTRSLIHSRLALQSNCGTNVSDCLHKFLLSSCEDELKEPTEVCLGFTFSYPATQNAINHGVLQTWTKGFDISGVEGHDVVEQLGEALAKKNIPIKVTSVINDTTGTLCASNYVDPQTKMGIIFGTGCNAAYYEKVKNIPKLEGRLPSDIGPEDDMAINCEWGAFDNQHYILPYTTSDLKNDAESPRPGQQAF